MIRTPDEPAMTTLCERLMRGTRELDVSGRWPREQLRWLAESGVYRWFLPENHGGFAWNEADLLRGYMRLSAACLTTTFILTQQVAAANRIVASDNQSVQERLLPSLALGERVATVGISQLTTSRRHTEPVLRADELPRSFVLEGYSPWVTGALHADVLVLGAACDNGQQLLVAVDARAPGVAVPAPEQLVGLTASHTGQVQCRRVVVAREDVLFGPMENVIAASSRSSAPGGLPTSALALGLSRAAIEGLRHDSSARRELGDAAESLTAELDEAEADLLALAQGEAQCTSDDIRVRANSLVLRSTQAQLSAAKGAGYVVGHPAGRMCREALFFLVWSCPAPVAAANLCELAGLT